MSKNEANQTNPIFEYKVELTNPQSHLFEVTLKVKNWKDSTLNLKFPVWTPGSYLIREYAKNLQNFQAKDEQNHCLKFTKITKNHWQVNTENRENIIIKYEIFANELTVRTNHLDVTHGYFNGAAMFFFIPGWEKEKIYLKIDPPKNWQVTTTLPRIFADKNIFLAEDFDTLVDSPFEIGNHQVYEFEVLGKNHQLAIWGKGNFNPVKIIEDTSKIIKIQANLFNGLPYENYLFLLHVSSGGYGGLEHKNSCSLNYPRFNFQETDKYNRFIQLVAHEFFHLWNVKRIRPQALENFDYEQENYTTSLWFSEGTTSYYDNLMPLRAGIYDGNFFLHNLSQEITRLLNTPGRKVQPVSEASFDTWIKLYRRDNNSDNCQISYYLKGELVSLLLDLIIRKTHNNKRSLDQVMQRLWFNFGKDEIGFTPDQLKEVIETVANQDLSNFFNLYIDGTEELPFNDYFEPFGLELKSVEDDPSYPYLGIRVNSENGKEIIKFVDRNSPAGIIGIDPEDELLAIDNIRISADQLNNRLKDYHSGDTIAVTIFHQDELITYPVTLADPQPSRHQVVVMKNRSHFQKKLLSGWLHQ
jgi:predicted metalloprotease with PDZ domain